MGTTKDFLIGEVRRMGEQTKTLLALGESEGRPLNEEENAKVEQNLRQIADWKSRIGEIEDRERLEKALDDASIPDPSPAPSEPRSLGEAFVKSDAYRARKSAGFTGAWSTGAVEFEQKLTDAGLSVASIEDAGGTLPLQPQVAPMVSPAEQRLTIADLFGQGNATQNTIVYLEETTTTAGAYTTSPYNSPNLPATAVLTSEGQAKPAAFVDFTRRSVELSKIAAFLPISDEMIEDEPQIASYINGRLALFVRQAEEAHLMTTLLAASIGSADSADIGGTNLFDAIAAGINSVQTVAGLQPDALVINPTDFWSMSILKASAGTGAYFSGGPYAGPAANPWGLRAVVTQAVAQGSPLVGAFRDGATVWRKGGLSVEASNSHSDYFRKNLTAIRAEERLGLAIYRPKAFCEVAVVS